jgi:hypothetical protein
MQAITGKVHGQWRIGLIDTENRMLSVVKANAGPRRASPQYYRRVSARNTTALFRFDGRQHKPYKRSAKPIRRPSKDGLEPNHVPPRPHHATLYS